MLLSIAAIVMVLAAGQSDRPTSGGTDPGLPAEGSPSAGAAEQVPASESLTGPAGIPFMPSVAAFPGYTRGVFLDIALLSEVRARTLNVTDTSTTWGTELEVTPGIALEVATPSLKLSVGYAPRFTIPFDVGTPALALLNRATLRAEWRASELWSATAEGIFVAGDYSQLVPASTPGGAGPPPPTLNPIRSFQTYAYVGIDALLRIDGVLSQRSRIRLSGGYFDVGGVGEVGQANQPRTWGPQAGAAFDWDASPQATLTTTVAAQDWMMVGDYSVLLATLKEGWRQAWSTELSTTLAAGAGLSNRDVESATAAGHLVPVASIRLDYRQEARQPLTISAEAALGPYVDTYLQIAYQRVTIGGSITWNPSDTWRLNASLSTALVPYSAKAPESYGSGGLSANFAPVQFLILSAGGFTQAQFQGPEATFSAFRQWTVYFSLTLLERIGL